MERILIWIIVILAILCASGVAAIITMKENLEKSKSDANHAHRLLDIYAQDEKEYLAKIDEIKDKTEKLINERDQLREKISELKLQLQEVHGNRKQIDNMKKLVEQQEERYQTIQTQLNELDVLYAEKVKSLETINLSKNEVENQIRGLVAQYDGLEAQIAAMTGVKENLEGDICELKEMHLNALRRVEGTSEGQSGWIMTLAPHETRLIEVIDEVVGLYPDLKVELNSIKWKKIWLPKIQELSGRVELDGKMGIYKLTLIENEKISYVGQAVNIKERWYQHMKKMLGVDNKGMERLYKYGDPSLFRWEVVEEISDRGKLDEREKYWIEFYGCKEWGLNKR